MGRLKTQKIRSVPRWATCYLYYGDDSGLDIESGEKKLADDFFDRLYKEGLRLVCPIDGSDSEFEPHPAFGPACDTIDWIAEELPKTYEIELNETLFAKFRIEAGSRKEAAEKAIEHVKGGYESWLSKGMKVKRCKEVPREELAG